jgi:fumarate reductase subunit D
MPLLRLLPWSRQHRQVATIQAGTNAVKRAAANPLLELLERLGYGVRGALYSVMGLLALGIALGIGIGQTTDLSGSLVFLTGNPLGKLLLVVAAVGLSAYALWGFTRAIYDPLHRGRGAGGYAARIGFVTSALSYAAIVIFALQLLFGSSAASGNGTRTTIASILSHPGGGWLTVIIGLVAIGVGLGQFLEAYRATFKEDLKGAAMSESERSWAIRFGRFGMFARGVTFLVIGWFLIQAGLHHDAGQVQGFGGAFMFLLGQPFGRVVLGIIALGFVALGLHSFACARWIRLMGGSA